MANFKSVVDVKPTNAVESVKSQGKAVVDVQPSMVTVGFEDTQDDVVREIGRGMPMLLWYITYPTTELITP